MNIINILLIGLILNFITYKIFCNELQDINFKNYGIKRAVLMQVVVFIVFLLLYFISPEFYVFSYKGILISLLIITSFVDVKFFIVPNGIVCTGLAMSLIINFNNITHYILGALAGFVPLLIIIVISRGGMGGGDMKLFAMIGSFLGPIEVLVVLFIAIIIAGLFSIFAIAIKKMTLKSKLPFVPFIALATLLFILFEEEIINFLAVYYNIKI
jgi:prepilin signal peptidase PulO-like enzyme (type II secretory pathway)